MPHHEVAVATLDPKFRYLCIRLLHDIGLEFILCAPGDDLCESAVCVLTTEEEAGDHSFPASVRNRLVAVDDMFDSEAVAITLLVQARSVHNPQTIVVGVDPGMRFGLALVIDGTPIYTTISPTPARAAELTRHWSTSLRQLFPDFTLEVRLGTGSKLYSALYLRALRHCGHIRISMVNEQNTTRTGGSDQSSAMIIAGRSGRPPTSADTQLKLKTGYIQSLKHLVKRLTDGRRTLSTEEARLILTGALSLESIIEAI